MHSTMKLIWSRYCYILTGADRGAPLVIGRRDSIKKYTLRTKALLMGRVTHWVMCFFFMPLHVNTRQNPTGTESERVILHIPASVWAPVDETEASFDDESYCVISWHLQKSPISWTSAILLLFPIFGSAVDSLLRCRKSNKPCWHATTNRSSSLFYGK